MFVYSLPSRIQALVLSRCGVLSGDHFFLQTSLKQCWNLDVYYEVWHGEWDEEDLDFMAWSERGWTMCVESKKTRHELLIVER